MGSCFLSEPPPIHIHVGPVQIETLTLDEARSCAALHMLGRISELTGIEMAAVFKAAEQVPEGSQVLMDTPEGVEQLAAVIFRALGVKPCGPVAETRH